MNLLVNLNGEATPQEVYTPLAERFPEITEEDLKQNVPNYPRLNLWERTVRFARLELVKKGHIHHKLTRMQDGGGRETIWRITENGRQFLGNPTRVVTGSNMKTPNVILYGPPGTGKTYATVSVAAQLLLTDAASKSWGALIENGEADDTRKKRREEFYKQLGKRIHFITFHQSYSYEDFIGGLRPDLKEDTKDLKFEWQPGVFLRACAAAFKVAQTHNHALKKTPAEGEKFKDDVDEFLKFCGTAELASYKEPEGKTYPSVVLVIDEINRANMSRVFGELITLLEEDKRLGGDEQLIVQLPNNPDYKFGVPKNLIIIGTMNTADKSLALLDLALRRRFEFVRLDPISPIEMPLDRRVEGVGNLWEILKKLNNELAARKKSTDFAVGHAYLLNVTDKFTFESALDRKIVPLLEEYFGGNHEVVLEVLKDAGIPIGEKEIKSKDRKFRCIIRPVKLQ